LLRLHTQDGQPSETVGMISEPSIRRAAAVIAWLLAAALVFVTWGPQSMRPHLADPGLERFGAFFVTGVMFVIGYPRRATSVAVGVVVFAIALELGQFLAPGRDPGVPDAIAKAFGGLAGVLATVLTLQALRPKPKQAGS
jgi:VanZ family protein